MAPTVLVFLAATIWFPGDRLLWCVYAGIAEAEAFDDVETEWFPGQLFDIVKIEERETWTARFLRTEAGSNSGGSYKDFRWVHVF